MRVWRCRAGVDSPAIDSRTHRDIGPGQACSSKLRGHLSRRASWRCKTGRYPSRGAAEIITAACGRGRGRGRHHPENLLVKFLKYKILDTGQQLCFCHDFPGLTRPDIRGSLTGAVRKSQPFPISYLVCFLLQAMILWERHLLCARQWLKTAIFIRRKPSSSETIQQWL
jgi:hypothetical protein